AQKARVGQIVLQTAAAENLATALTEAETAKKLDLSKEQVAKLTTLNTDAIRLHALRTTHLGAQSQVIGLEMRDATDARLLAVLTDSQKKKWKELTGDPVEGLQKTIPGRGLPPGIGGP
ncbi:MAG: hypothetical protein K2V38_17065, partial [Gemmataceae bacterium]|nr:hypothetical protein [Gemmataceae bacterium]